jgi:hypothetical protein
MRRQPSNLLKIKIMRGTGFEPAQALSYSLLRAARLTTPTPPHIRSKEKEFLKIFSL